MTHPASYFFLFATATKPWFSIVALRLIGAGPWAEHSGLDPETALELIQTLLYGIACILGGSALLGISAYIVFLSLQIFSPQPRSKTRLAKVPHPIGCAPVAEESLDLNRRETPIPAEAERLGEETVRVPALPHDAQMTNPLDPGASLTSRDCAGETASRAAFVPDSWELL